MDPETFTLFGASGFFWIGALIGVGVLFFDSFRRYDEFDRASTIYLEFNNAPPSLLTTPLVYHQSLLVYYILRVGAFILPAIVVPVILINDPNYFDVLYGGLIEESPAIKNEINSFVTKPFFPVLWAFASAGFVSLLPYVIAIEPRLRRFAQGSAFIAQSVQRRLNMIHRSDLRMPHEPVGDAAPDAFLREIEPGDVADGAEWHSLEKRWMRLAQILRLLDPSNRAGVASRFIEEHPEPFRRLTEEFHGLRVRVRYYRTLTREVDAAAASERLDLLDRLSKHDPELLRDVNRLLASAEKTLAAALPTSSRLIGRSSQRLRELGFLVEEVEEDMSFGLIFVAIFVGCVAGFFGTLLARGLVELLSASPMIDYDGRGALEEASGIIAYYAAMFAAVAIGALWLGAKAAGLRPDDIHPPSYFQRPLGQYVFAGAVGAALSFVFVLIVLGVFAGLERAAAFAPLIAIFLPSLFMTNFMVLFPIYRPSKSLAGLLAECALLALVVAVASFITWVAFDGAINARLEAAGETARSDALVLGRAIFNAVRSFFVNAAVFAAIVYMAHQLRAARRLDAGAGLGAGAEAVRVEPVAALAPAR